MSTPSPKSSRIGDLTLFEVDKITYRRTALTHPQEFISTEMTYWQGGEPVFTTTVFTSGKLPPTLEYIPLRGDIDDPAF